MLGMRVTILRLLLHSHELLILLLMLLRYLVRVHLLSLLRYLLVKELRIDGRGRFDDHLVVLVSVMITHFFLVIGASPLTVHYVLVLIFARRQRMKQVELVARAGHPLHGRALLPVAEGADD